MLEWLQQSPSSLIWVNIIIMLNISHEMMIGRQLGSAKQLLIVPITFWSGLEQGFFGADFTAVPHSSSFFSFISIIDKLWDWTISLTDTSVPFQGFITCAFGVHTVGRVLILYGAANALASIAAGFLRRQNTSTVLFYQSSHDLWVGIKFSFFKEGWTPAHLPHCSRRQPGRDCCNAGLYIAVTIKE